MLTNIKATCFPGFEGELDGAIFSDARVVRDGSIITAAGMGVAQEFGLPVLARLPINPAVAEAFDGGLMETVDTAHLADAIAAMENA